MSEFKYKSNCNPKQDNPQNKFQTVLYKPSHTMRVTESQIMTVGYTSYNTQCARGKGRGGDGVSGMAAYTLTDI